MNGYTITRTARQALPTLETERGHAYLGARVTCEPSGEMNDGTLVWSDDEGNQYFRVKINHKYYFILNAI